MSHFATFPCIAAIASALLSLAAPSASAEVGDDLIPVFRRAAAGAPLRVAMVGGSITQDGAGRWVEPWLEETFPDSAVVVHNLGMSAMGSSFAVFRVERDIVPIQPDLVFLEFTVNDFGMPDARTILFLETMVVRLKSLGNPPAIVFLEAASRLGSQRERHQKVAAHYGLLDIDLQIAADSFLAESKLDWKALFSDDVHPNSDGHALYSRAIAAALKPYIERAAAAPDATARAVPAQLPAQLSEEPLWLDATIAALPACQGWHRVPSLQRWWDAFFLGTIAPDSGTEIYHIPFVGTDVGILFPMDAQSFGTFYVSVDGDFPDEVNAHSRDGYGTWGRWCLEPGEHIATVFAPAGGPGIQLGALMTAGSSRPAAPGRIPPRKAAFRVEKKAIPLDRIEWSGPYGTEYICDTPFHTDALHLQFPPESKDGAEVEWKRLEGDGGRVDLAALTGYSDRGVSYIRTTLESKGETTVHLGIGLDYFGKLWVNGELVASFEGGYGPYALLRRTVALRDGPNELMLKVHSGSQGNGCELCILDVQRDPPAQGR